MTLENSKWKKFTIGLEAKYGERESWFGVANRAKGSVWWRGLRKWCQLDYSDGWLSRKIQRRLKDGREIKFWKNIWLGSDSLQSKYRRIFLNSNQQDLYVSDIRSGRMRSGVGVSIGEGNGLKGKFFTSFFFFVGIKGHKTHQTS